MTIPVAIAASIIAAGGAFLIALAGALFNINNKLGRLDAHQEILEKGQQKLTTEIRDARDYIDTQLAAAEKRALTREDAAEKRALAREDAAEKRAIAREAAAEERALARHEAAMAEIRAVERAVEERSIARHNELMAEIRLWRHHGHDADGNIFFRVPE
jgi:flagellar biosynthesis GTPase FlhF